MAYVYVYALCLSIGVGLHGGLPTYALLRVEPSTHPL